MTGLALSGVLTFVMWLQTDGFASDSTRMIKEVKKGKPDAAVQILLFSATFDDTIRTFANNIVGGTANQVIPSFQPQ